MLKYDIMVAHNRAIVMERRRTDGGGVTVRSLRQQWQLIDDDYDIFSEMAQPSAS